MLMVLRQARICRRPRVGRGEGQGYFAYYAEMWFESTWSMQTLKRIALEPAGSSSEVERLMFPDRLSRPAVFDGRRCSEKYSSRSRYCYQPGSRFELPKLRHIPTA